MIRIFIPFITHNDYEFISLRENLRDRYISEVNEHIRMVFDASLASCDGFNRQDPTKTLKAMKLTMQGYDLLAVMEYESMWKQIKSELKTNSLPLTVFSIMELGKQLTLNKIKVIE